MQPYYYRGQFTISYLYVSDKRRNTVQIFEVCFFFIQVEKHIELLLCTMKNTEMIKVLILFLSDTNKQF